MLYLWQRQKAVHRGRQRGEEKRNTRLSHCYQTSHSLSRQLIAGSHTNIGQTNTGHPGKLEFQNNTNNVLGQLFLFANSNNFSPMRYLQKAIWNRPLGKGKSRGLTPSSSPKPESHWGCSLPHMSGLYSQTFLSSH